MTRTLIPCFSEQKLTPRASDAIRLIMDMNGFEDYDLTWYKSDDPRVLVFGSQAPPQVGKWDRTEYIHTYSIAQIMGKANAATILTASLKLWVGGKHVPSSDTFPTMARVISPVNYGFRYDRPVVIDIETNGNLGKTHTAEEVQVISIAMYDGNAQPVVWLNPAHASEDHKLDPLAMSTLLMFAEELPKYEKVIYHNGKFDTRILNRVLGVKLCVWFDTMLAHHVLNHAAGMHGLKELAMRYFGAPDWESGAKQFTKGGGHYEYIPPNQMVEYNGWDVYWTWKLFEMLKPQIDMDDDNTNAFAFELAAAEFLLTVEMNGIPFSFEDATNLVNNTQSEMDYRLGLMRGIVDDDKFNPGSWQQVKRHLEHEGYSVPNTNEATLTFLKEDAERISDTSTVIFIESLLAYRGASKAQSTYAVGWGNQARQLPGDEQPRVRPTFLVHGTSTGRLSSTKPNAQNMPRDKAIRKIVSIVETQEHPF